MQNFIFGGNTPWTAEQLRAKQKLAEQLRAANMQTPQNVGEGLSAIGRALQARRIENRAGTRETELQSDFSAQLAALLGGGSTASSAPAPLSDLQRQEAWDAGVSAAPAQPVMSEQPIIETPIDSQGAPIPVESSLRATLAAQSDMDQASNVSAVGGPPAGGTDVQSRLLADLQRDFNLTPEQAAGVVGNLAHETGGFTQMQELNPTVPGSRGGYGYAQWTGPRRRAFEAWTQENGLDPNSYEANYGFLAHELRNTPEGRVLADLRNAPDVTSAAQTFSEQFLRPGTPRMDSRINFAQQAAQGGNLGPMPQAQGGSSAAPQSAPPAPQMDIQQIMELMNNPMATPAQQQYLSMLLEQQMQGPQDNTPEDIVELQMRARMAGLEEGTPEFQAFMLNNGDMPANETGFRRATPEEAAAYGAESGQFGPDGRFYPIDVPQGMSLSVDADGNMSFVQGAAGATASTSPYNVARDKAFAADALAWEQGGGADMVGQIAQLNGVLAQLEAGEPITGPIVGQLPDWWNSFANPSSVAARERVEEVVQRNLRLILGAQFTNEEGKRLIARAYNPSLTPEENASRLRRLIEQMSQAAEQKQAMVDYVNENGTLSGFQGRAPQISDFEAAIEGSAETPAETGAIPPSFAADPNVAAAIAEGIPIEAIWAELSEAERAQYNGG